MPRARAVAYAPLTVPELRIDLAALDTLLSAGASLARRTCLRSRRSRTSPASSTRSISSLARTTAGWDVLLDAAAFVPTNRLDLREVQPDFVSVSFYKMFGYPTGVGCLLVRKHVSRHAAPSVVCRRHGQLRDGAGGRRHILSPGEAGFEDGTLNYFSIAGRRDRAAASGRRRHRRDPDARATASPAGCSNGCSRCATRTAVRWSASTVR